MRHQLLEDKAFYPLLLEATYKAGPKGLPMRELILLGKKNGWWQDTADKHFGEKMRAAWAYGLLVVPEYPGDHGTKQKRIVHPAYFTITFQSNWLAESWAKLLDALKTFNFMPKEKDR